MPTVGEASKSASPASGKSASPRGLSPPTRLSVGSSLGRGWHSCASAGIPACGTPWILWPTGRAARARGNSHGMRRTLVAVARGNGAELQRANALFLGSWSGTPGRPHSRGSGECRGTYAAKPRPGKGPFLTPMPCAASQALTWYGMATILPVTKGKFFLDQQAQHRCHQR